MLLWHHQHFAKFSRGNEPDRNNFVILRWTQLAVGFFQSVSTISMILRQGVKPLYFLFSQFIFMYLPLKIILKASNAVSIQNKVQLLFNSLHTIHPVT